MARFNNHQYLLEYKETANMKDIYELPFFDLLGILKKYIKVFKGDDILEKQEFMQQHSEIFTEEFRQYLRGFLYAVGFTDEFLDQLHAHGNAVNTPTQMCSVH